MQGSLSSHGTRLINMTPAYPSHWQDGFVDVNGVKIHYLRSGSGKPPLFFLHGVFDDGACWTRVAKVLEKDYEVVMWDARGHGKSLLGGEQFSFDVMADDAAHFIEALGLEKPVLVGHSMGGQTATLVAARYPDLVSRLVLEDPAYFFPRYLSALVKLAVPFLLWNMKRNASRTKEEMMAICRKHDPGWHDEEVEPWAESKIQAGKNLKQFKIKDVRLKVDWHEVFPAVRCPVLLIIPSDGILKIKKAREIQGEFPNCQVAYIENAGHSVRRDQFDAFMEVVTRFLNAPSGELS